MERAKPYHLPSSVLREGKFWGESLMDNLLPLGLHKANIFSPLTLQYQDQSHYQQ